jgi:hypothetical protein
VGRVTGLNAQFNELHLAVSEVDVLATIVAEWFDDQDWHGADPVTVERAALLLGMLARAATVAGSKVDVLEASIADAQPATAGELWDFPEDTPAGTRSFSAASAPSVSPEDQLR